MRRKRRGSLSAATKDTADLMLEARWSMNYEWKLIHQRHGTATALQVFLQR
ncbi:hypothetical protein [Oceanobacillus massiliensis]|uniref:hypothetical protein n=1 Tax=Oceanobacillus massiliensis TaxID=1465765 RepID=UPI0002E619D5|nr:hypothetical protein [Oceanobacillus massiliensis]